MVSADAFLEDLARTFPPDQVLADETTRREYAVDASPCCVPPFAVVRARSEADVVGLVQLCARHGVALTPRAAGTSLSGAAIGPGVVMDTARLHAILDFDAVARTVRVQPGVPLQELNAFLAERGFRFPLEPGSRDWCRIGGMIGHNASGYQSVKYGQMSAYVVSLRVVLADGSVLDARDTALAGPQWREVESRTPALARIRVLLEAKADAIESHRLSVRKHSCGYGLADIVAALRRGTFPIARLFVGSEGTLGIVTEATLRVVPVPASTVTLLLFLDRFEDLAPLVGDLLPMGPSAIEGIDGDSLDVLGRGAHGVPPSARAMLLVEFDEGDLAGLADRVVRGIAPRYAMSRPPEAAFEGTRQATLWHARRSLFPTLLRRPGRRRPWGFVEDPIVPPDRVAEFIAFLAELARRHGTIAGIYGHLGDGNAHYRPLFDPTDPADLARMIALRDEFDEALLGRFHGAPSGEHGIGRIRAETLPRIWGPEVTEVLRAVKAALDPDGILNPGVLFSSAPWWETWAGLESRLPQ